MAVPLGKGFGLVDPCNELAPGSAQPHRVGHQGGLAESGSTQEGDEALKKAKKNQFW